MADTVEMSAAQAVELLAATTGDAYELVGRLSGGETGATRSQVLWGGGSS